MIDQLEKLKNIMNENDSEIESMYAIVLAVVANIIPGILFLFFYKRNLFLEFDFWKLILISVSVTVPIFMMNYWIITMQASIKILSDPEKLARQAIMNDSKKNKLKNSKKNKKEDTHNQATELIIDELYNTFMTRNKNILYITSKKMIFIFSVILISFYYLDLKEYLLIYKIYIFLYIELIFFVAPTLFDWIGFKSFLKKQRKNKKTKQTL